MSLSLAFIGGTAAMPHVLMRFFTVSDAAQARRSAAIAVGLIAYFQIIVLIIGFGAVVVSGITLSAGATVSHDLFSNVIRHHKCSEAEELFISRTTVVVLGILGMSLAIFFEGQNVAILATFPLAIGASTNFPVLFYPCTGAA